MKNIFHLFSPYVVIGFLSIIELGILFWQYQKRSHKVAFFILSPSKYLLILYIHILHFQIKCSMQGTLFKFFQIDFFYYLAVTLEWGLFPHWVDTKKVIF